MDLNVLGKGTWWKAILIFAAVAGLGFVIGKQRLNHPGGGGDPSNRGAQSFGSSDRADFSEGQPFNQAATTVPPSSQPTPPGESLRRIAIQDAELNDLIRNMTWKQKVGQLLMLNFNGTTVPRSVQSRMRDWCPGAFILTGRNLRGPKQTKALTDSLQSLSKENNQGIGLLLAADEEGGKITRLKWMHDRPSAAALGRLGIDATVLEAQRTAEAFRKAGLNMCLAPVLDVLTERRNPIIGGNKERSFGEDPDLVAQHGVAYIQALQTNGVIAVAKHFPGHGATLKDSHASLPELALPFDTWRRYHLKPFTEAVQVGRVDAVMTAHIAYRFDDRDFVESKRPATRTHYFVNDVLRNHLGFNGVVLSDSMMMKGAYERGGWEHALIEAINAGVDMLVITDEASESRQIYANKVLVDAVASKAIPEQRVDEAVGHVLRLKLDYGLLFRRDPNARAATQSAQRVTRR